MGDLSDGREFLAGEYGPGARDQRLGEFAQGGWADAAPGSGWLALQAGDVSRAEVLGEATDDEILGVGRAWKALEAWSFAGKLAIVRELIRRHPLNEYDEPGLSAGGLPADWDPRLYHEVAAALGISLAAAAKLTGIAWTLQARLPGIGGALEQGRLDPGRVKMIVEQTAVLESEDMFGQAEAIILAGLPGCTTWTDLERLVQRAVITVDPAGAEKRRKKAERDDARIRFWREASGACALAGMGLPTDQALAARAHVEARAREYQAVPIARPIDILRVMAYLDILNGVPVAQRIAWVRAEDEAAKADGEQATRDARPGDGQDPDDGVPGAPDGGGPDGGGPDGGGALDRHPDHGAPDNGGPNECDLADDVNADEDGLDDGPPPEGTCAGCHPGVCSCRDRDLGEPACADCRDRDCTCGGSPPAEITPASGDGPGGGVRAGPPARGSPKGGDHRDDDPGGGTRPGSGPDGTPCPRCGGAGVVAGLPIKVNLTIPAGALDWLAEWSAGSHELASGAEGGHARPGGHGPSAGPWPGCGTRGGRSTSLPIREHFAFPLLTLLHLAERPGEAHALGSLDPALLRDLTATGALHPGSEFCVTVTDDHGHAIGHGCGKPMRTKAAGAIAADRLTFRPSGRPGPDGGFGSWTLTLPGAPRPLLVGIDVVPVDDCDHRHASAGYKPGGKLRHLIEVRDGKCSYPPCSRHARDSDFEHATPYDQGGATCACNAHACSRACHRVKQSEGWQVTKPRPGWTRWTTMAGRTYLQGPWRYPALTLARDLGRGRSGRRRRARWRH